jgi:hypothetical protein
MPQAARLLRSATRAWGPRIILALLALMLLAGSAFFLAVPDPAAAETVALSLSPDQSLSLTGSAVTLSLSGQASQNLNGTVLILWVKGPVDSADVGNDATDAVVAARFTQVLGVTPDAAAPATATPSGTSTPEQLAAGALTATLALPAGTPAAPGAYLLIAEVVSGDTILASGTCWVGVVAPRVTPLDVSFILPVSLGVHRDVDGAFVDRALEAAITPIEGGTASLRGLVPLADRFPGWNFTLAPEPLLLAQLRDMADGYVSKAASGEQIEVGENDLAPQNAVAVLDDLRELAARDSIEVAISPYAGADLGLLAAEGWSDGFEQVQMGKQELQQTLGLEAPISGAYSPDLSLTSGSLSCYADASVDRLVVGTDVRGALNEELPPSAVAVRARNAEGDRVTLVMADRTVSWAIRPPWDASLLGAAVAATLASGPLEALVIAPEDVFEPIPASYLEGIAGMLTNNSWIRTQTLEQLVETHSPGNRLVLFQTAPAQPDGYIEEVLQSSVRSAHSAVDDLAVAADTTRTPVDRALRLLYAAEARWWSRAGASPQEASMGLSYAAEAEAVAESELSKLSLVKVDSPLVTGEEGTLRLIIENAADYPMTVELRLAGAGLTFPEGDRLSLELTPGRTELTFKVASESGPHRVDASLAAGSRVVDESSSRVRFLRLMAVLPWLIVVAALLGMGGVYLLVRRRLRKRSMASQG